MRPHGARPPAASRACKDSGGTWRSARQAFCVYDKRITALNFTGVSYEKCIDFCVVADDPHGRGHGCGGRESEFLRRMEDERCQEQFRTASATGLVRSQDPA